MRPYTIYVFICSDWATRGVYATDRNAGEDSHRQTVTRWFIPPNAAALVDTEGSLSLHVEQRLQHSLVTDTGYCLPFTKCIHCKSQMWTKKTNLNHIGRDKGASAKPQRIPENPSLEGTPAAYCTVSSYQLNTAFSFSSWDRLLGSPVHVAEDGFWTCLFLGAATILHVLTCPGERTGLKKMGLSTWLIDKGFLQACKLGWLCPCLQLWDLGVAT